jgi:RNA polymerase sigma-70 factor (ECF subfamily)
MRSDLVRRAQSGDSEAFETLIRAAYDRLFAVADRILRDRYAAEDAVQDAVVRCWRDIRGLRDPDRFEAWLYRLVVNASRDHTRRQLRQRRALPDGGVLPPDLRATGDDYARLVEHDALEGAFLTLSADHRIVLLLAHYAGYSAPEIAAILSVPTGTVYSRLHYAMRAMRAALAPTVGVPATTTGALR